MDRRYHAVMLRTERGKERSAARSFRFLQGFETASMLGRPAIDKASANTCTTSRPAKGGASVDDHSAFAPTAVAIRKSPIVWLHCIRVLKLPNRNHCDQIHFHCRT